MRRTALAVIVLLVVTSAALAAAITVKVNGTAVRANEAPFTRHDTKFVEIEPVCKAVGADYKREADGKRITICHKGACTSFKVGDGPKDAYLKNDHPCAAFEELARKLGGSATFDSAANTISFTIQ